MRATTCGSLTHFGLAVALLVISAGQLTNDEGRCLYGEHGDFTLCTAITVLAAVTLLITLSCVTCGLLCTAESCVGLLVRMLLTAAWLGTSIAATVLGIMASRHGGRHDGYQGWRIAGVVLCWVMFAFTLLMAVASGVRAVLCCGLTACCCCGDERTLMACAEALCLAWLVRWLLDDCCSDGVHMRPPTGPFQYHYHDMHTPLLADELPQQPYLHPAQQGLPPRYLQPGVVYAYPAAPAATGPSPSLHSDPAARPWHHTWPLQPIGSSSPNANPVPGQPLYPPMQPVAPMMSGYSPAPLVQPRSQTRG